jgi:hypothetical protein
MAPRYKARCSVTSRSRKTALPFKALRPLLPCQIWSLPIGSVEQAFFTPVPQWRHGTMPRRLLGSSLPATLIMLASRILHRLSMFAFVPGALVTLAQTPQPRLAGSISDAPRITLAQSRTPAVAGAQDLGPLSRDMQIHGITLVFRRSASQEAELQRLLIQQQTQGDPAYHRWLTPESFAARFGIAEADIRTASNWLKAQGFVVNQIARTQDRITFSGSAAQVQSAFRTELHRYRVHGNLHFAPAGDLSLPAQLGAITAAVLHLSDFRPRPSWNAAITSKPNYTEASGAHFLVPADIVTMYGLTGTSAAIGAAQIAVVGQSYVNTGLPSAVETFSALTALNGVAPVQPILVPNSGVEAVSWGDEGESEIDLEYINVAGAAANPFLVFVGDQQNYSVLDALAYTITEDVAPVVSISYGLCEPLLSATELDQYNALFEQAASQGQTIVASSGDSGSTACSPEPVSSGITTAESQALAVNFPASSPYVTAVGGTQMAAGTFEPGTSAYWAPSSDPPINKGGTLLSYVPEVVWNEGSAANGIVAGGGGSSAYFLRPPWQSSLPGVPAGSYRLVPDVAMQSSVNSPGFVFCTSDPTLLAAEAQTASCVEALAGSNNKLTIGGGTSFAAPIFAGMLASLNVAQHGTGLGNINAQLYQLAATPATYAAAFHDITTGTNACVAGATNCAAGSQGDYAAQPGYDEATGLGSLDFAALLAALPASSTGSLQQTAVIIVPSNYSPSAGENFSLLVNVASLSLGSAATAPTGSVSVTVDGTAVASDQLPGADASQRNSAVTFTITAPATAGYHLLKATYSGDASHAPWSAVYPLLIGSVTATGTVSLQAANLAVQANSVATTQVTATPAAGYSGELLWTLNITGGGPALTACYSILPLVVNSISTTTLKLGVGTACNSAAPSLRETMRSLRYGGSSGKSARMQPSGFFFPAGSAAVLLFGSFAGRRWSRGRTVPLVSILLSALMLIGLTGCGGGGSSAPASTGSSSSGSSASSSSGSQNSAATYTMVLQGTDSVNGSIEASTTFTLTVN